MEKSITPLQKWIRNHGLSEIEVALIANVRTMKGLRDRARGFRVARRNVFGIKISS